MTKLQKKKWISALRSGKYKQSKGQLKSGDGYCCLGVANTVCRLGNHSDDAALSSDFLPSHIQSKLIAFNDAHNMPFDLIAGFIQHNIEPTR